MFNSIAVQSQGGRPYQEDRFMFSPSRVVVCDGMGGHDGGADAAEAAVRALWDSRKASPQASLHDAIVGVHRTVLQLGKTTGRKDMGCTLITVEARGPDVYWGHVGDSRIYWWKHRERSLVAVTVDHTIGGAWLSAGRIGPEEYEAAEFVPNLLSCIGGGLAIRDLTVDVGCFRPAVGDLILCATDGVFGPLKRDLGRYVAKVAANWAEARSVCTEILAESRRRGDTDNKTLILSRWL